MHHISDIKPKELSPGIFAQLVHGDKCSLSVVELKKGSISKEHSHPHEQITYILEGQIDMVIGGRAVSLTAGMYYVIPSNTLHSAIAPIDCKLIDLFSPVREDYK